MNIAINGRFFARPLTGVERTAYELTKQLASNLAHAGQSLTVFVPRGVQPPHIPGAVYKSVGVLRGQLWEQIELPWFARGHVLLNLCNLSPLLHGNSYLLIHDFQVATAPDSYSVAFRLWYKFVEPLMARRARFLSTVSSFSKAVLIANGVGSEEKLAVVSNGCDHIIGTIPDVGVFKRLSIEQNAKYIIAIGGRAKHKNIKVVLQALDRVLTEDLQLLVVGGGNGAAFTGSELTLSPRTRFVGRVTDEELKALIQRAQLLVFPSKAEGFGLPPLEAMALGCPVIVSTAASMPEVCGAAAIYADPDDPTEWAEKIDGLCADDERRLRMIGLGYERAALFTWASAAAAVEEMIYGGRTLR